jgi:hypothetical protein
VKFLSKKDCMKHRINARALGCSFVVGLAAALAPLAAQAQPANEPWRWELGVYGWLPSVGGSTSFPSAGTGGPHIDVTSEDVINALKMVFMGNLEARKGQWGVWSDLAYADLGGSKSGTRNFTVGHLPVGVDANLGLDVKATAWTTAGLYNVASSKENTTDVLFGVRLMSLKEKLNWGLSSAIAELPARSGVSELGLTHWDAVVGVKGRYFLGDDRKWFLPYYADMGTGESKLTWQVNGGVGYQFDWGSVFANYRYLCYQFKSGSAIETMNLSGALVGVSFQL